MLTVFIQVLYTIPIKTLCAYKLQLQTALLIAWNDRADCIPEYLFVPHNKKFAQQLSQ